MGRLINNLDFDLEEALREIESLAHIESPPMEQRAMVELVVICGTPVKTFRFHKNVGRVCLVEFMLEPSRDPLMPIVLGAGEDVRQALRKMAEHLIEYENMHWRGLSPRERNYQAWVSHAQHIAKYIINNVPDLSPIERQWLGHWLGMAVAKPRGGWA